MLSRQCPFCENVNPPNSRFCNACGVQLHAALCPHCRAVNVVTATACVNCAGLLDAPGSAAPAQPATAFPDQPLQAAPAAAPVVAGAAHLRDDPGVTATVNGTERPLAYSVHFDPDHTVKIDRRYDADSATYLGAHHFEYAVGTPPRRQDLAPLQTQPHALTAQPPAHVAPGVAPAFDPRTDPMLSDALHYRRYATLLGMGIVALVAGSAYYLYHEHVMAEMSALIATSRELKAPDASSDAPARGEAQRTSTPGAAPAAAPTVAAPAVIAALPARAGAQPTPPADEPQRKLRAARGQIGSAEAAAAVAAAAAPPKPGDARSEARPQRLGPCTAAVAALGLCTPESPTTPRQ